MPALLIVAQSPSESQERGITPLPKLLFVTPGSGLRPQPQQSSHLP